jgi:DNA-binding transcriptional LysR family regulator
MAENDQPPLPPKKSVSKASLTKEQRSVLPPFSGVRAFEAIGSLGGIRRAATALSVDHAAVSRHLRTLEQWTGTTLVDRTNGSGGKLTPQGETYHQRITSALSELARATGDLINHTDDRSLRLWCVPGLASEWLSGRIGGFSSYNKDIDLELQPSDVQPDFDAHQADVYLSYRIDTAAEEPDPKLRTLELVRPPVLALASPDFVRNAPPFNEPADLLGSLLLHESTSDQWRRWFAHHGIDAGDRIAGPRFWQGHLTLAASRRGQGVALSNALLAHDDLQRGTLVSLGAWPPVHLGTYILTARRDHWRNGAVISFRRWLEKAIADSAQVTI